MKSKREKRTLFKLKKEYNSTCSHSMVEREENATHSDDEEIIGAHMQECFLRRFIVDLIRFRAESMVLLVMRPII